MKKVYERPIMYIEAFVANEAVSLCTVNESFQYEFDCMRGPNVDLVTSAINSTIASGCKYQVGWAEGYTKARNYSLDAGYSKNNTSNYISFDWDEGNNDNGSYVQVEYSAKAAGVTIDGLLYVNGQGKNLNTKNWDNEDGYWCHTNSNDGQHIMVAPVINVKSISNSW